MSELKRLSAVVARRSDVAARCTKVRFSIDRHLTDQFRAKANSEGLSMTMIVEAALRGYVNDHPSMLAMIDQWMRDEGKTPPEKRAPTLSRKDRDEIYAAIQRGTIADEE